MHPQSSQATSQSISLYCTEGSANKEYHIDLVPLGSGYAVNFRYGGRGKALTSGSKTPEPVEFAKASSIFNKLKAEKQAKGYTEDTSGVAYTNTANAGRVSGWRAPLLTPVSSVEVNAMMASDDFIATEKMDGERRAIEITQEGIQGINRKGLYVDVPDIWAHTLEGVPVGTIFDGEHIGDCLYVFDCPQLGDRSLRDMGYEKRSQLIAAIISTIEPSKSVRYLPMARAETQKWELLARVTRENGEGIVLRRRDGAYEAGLNERNFKFKLHEESTCVVTHVNTGVRSVGLGLIDDVFGKSGQIISVGNVTIPANHPVPAIGALVEVRYMHMFESGSLYQPVYKGARTDLDPSAAKLSQVTRIKLKSNAAQDADDDVAGESPTTEVPRVELPRVARKMRP